MKKNKVIIYFLLVVLIGACNPPPPKEKKLSVKHNYIILVDLSDRLIVQKEQPHRDKEIIKYIYNLFEQKVKKDLYIKSRDEIKVVIAPQKGSDLDIERFEDSLYVNMGEIQHVYRRPQEEARRNRFLTGLDELYKRAQFSKIPHEYYGADIWKYVYEDLKTDYSKDTLTKNFLFILTDGYPIVGKDLAKLKPVNKEFPNLQIILLEASPRDKDMEWDRVMALWTDWFESMEIEDYTFIKRRALQKVEGQIKEIISE